MKGNAIFGAHVYYGGYECIEVTGCIRTVNGAQALSQTLFFNGLTETKMTKQIVV